MQLRSLAIHWYGFMYEGCVQVFVCAFVKFIETNIVLVMSVCPFLCSRKQSAPNARGSLYLVFYFFFRNFSRRIEFH